MSVITRWWHRAFLVERPTIGLCLFRVAVAWTVGAHVIPSLLHLDENYLSTAFKTTNPSFFPPHLLDLAAASPDGLVYAVTGLFYAALIAFAFGLWSRISCVMLTLACYYFYALNSYHIGTLSWDILLVTLFLMCLTDYHGDSVSLDSLRRGDVEAFRRRAPFFVQRLLQLQLAATFWHTAVSKTHFVPAGAPLVGNWLTGNPYHTLMHYPAIGVVRDFPLRAWLAQQPQLCHGLGIALLLAEIALPFLWFTRRTRAVGIAIGGLFQLMLWATLHVPTIFLFLFPPMMLLFIDPEVVVQWVERRRAAASAGYRPRLLYDGRCGFCLESVARLRAADLFAQIELVDFRTQPDLKSLHPALTSERCNSEMVLVEPAGLSGGFDAFRRLTVRLPLLWGLAPFLSLPGVGWVGRRVYRWIAAHRDLLHRHPACAVRDQISPPGEI